MYFRVYPADSSAVAPKTKEADEGQLGMACSGETNNVSSVKIAHFDQLSA